MLALIQCQTSTTTFQYQAMDELALLIVLALTLQASGHYVHRRQSALQPGRVVPASQIFDGSSPVPVPQIQYQPIVYVPYVPLVDSCTQKKAQEDRNKRTVRRFTQQLFGEKNISIIDKFVAPDYIQHNPTVADGRDALKSAAHEWFRDDQSKGRVDIKRIAADGDLVWVHYKDKTEDGKTMAVVDIYKLKDGKIQEHWDVMQVLMEPEKSKNPHPLF